MRHVLLITVAGIPLLSFAALGQSNGACSCGANPPGRPAARSLRPYGGVPQDLRPYSKFTAPYFENYTDLIEYNGAARDVPDPQLKDLSEIRIGFLGPLYNHPDQAMGGRMLNGAQMAIDEANAAGGYCGKPFRLMLHNDSAIWGASSNEVVKMVYDDKVWAMFGSISGDTTHIALRLTLKAETPLVNSASTDPTIPETIIPWYLTDLQDDRIQGYTLARHIYDELGLKRIAILRVNDRYGRFGVLKFRDASRRLGHPVVIEQKFLPGDTDFRHQLRIIQDSRVDGIVLWTDIAPAADILLQMQQLGMKQKVFGSHRTMGVELLRLAGPAAEGFEALYPYDPTRQDPAWLAFNQGFDEKYHEKPDHFSALAYDAMKILLNAVCRAGLNKGRIRDALTALQTYRGVTGEMTFDPNCKNIHSMFLAAVHSGAIDYRPISTDRPYARVGEDGVQYAGPPSSTENGSVLNIAVFGPKASEVVHSPAIAEYLQTFNLGLSPNLGSTRISLIAIPSEGAWGQASSELVKAVYDKNALAIIALDRNSSHLAEQIGTKAFVPVVAISSDRALTSTNIPWIFRLDANASAQKGLQCLAEAIQSAGPNRSRIRDVLASGKTLAGLRFQTNGNLK
jgi:ABC-type branched-subunit amino acid transport system substrate-binding protein